MLTFVARFYHFPRLLNNDQTRFNLIGDIVTAQQQPQLNFGVVFVLWGPNGLVSGVGVGLTTVLESTHVVEQLSFSMFPSTLAFDFDLMLGSFLTFWALMGYFWG